MKESTGRRPPERLIAEAESHPGGWVYEIVGTFGPSEEVPPQAIKGAWKVDNHGHLTGEYRPNPRFVDPGSTSSGHRGRS